MRGGGEELGNVHLVGDTAKTCQVTLIITIDILLFIETWVTTQV